MPTPAGLRSPIQGLVGSVTSFTSPASACSLSVPPPHDWKMSGTLPPCIVVVSLDLKASFSSTVMLIFTFG